MFASDPALIEAVRLWVEKAENDLWLATLALRQRVAARSSEGIAFHAQQCAEKRLKSLLTWQSLAFPRTHDLEELIERWPERQRPALTIAEQRALTRYATVTRYPGDYEPITLTEARRAVTLARRVRRQVRRLLPKGVV